MTSRTRLAAILCCGTLALPPHMAPEAEPGGAQASGSAQASRVSGVVVTDDVSPQPVRRATVRVEGDTLGSSRLVGTGGDGRFVFDELPAGAFTLSAAKAGYVTTFHGARRPGRGPGVPVAVGTGEQVDVVLTLVRGAVIAGFVTDAFGKPAPSVPVAAAQVDRGRSGTAQPVRSTTDDRGEYRIFGLPAGEYLVSALPPLQAARQGARADAGDIHSIGAGEARWAKAVMDGRGSGLTAAAATPVLPAGRPVAYAPVYYPGTTDAVAAATISVGAGEERSGVSMSLQIAPMARLGGRLIGEGGGPVHPAIVLLRPGRSAMSRMADRLLDAGVLVLPTAAVTSERFSVSGVPPGEYTLVARSGSARQRLTIEQSANEMLWGVMDVAVTGSDQENLVVRMSRGPRVSGSVSFEGSSTEAPGDWSGTQIALAVVDTPIDLTPALRATADRSGRFDFRGIPPGAYLLQATPASGASAQPFTLGSARLNGRDIADHPLIVEAGASDLDGVNVVFTDRAAEIAGRLLDAGGQPMSGYAIVVVTTDRTMWLPSSRRIRSVPLATDGSFRVRGLPAGEYAIAALQDVHEADLTDPEFLSSLVDAGYVLTLNPGDVVQQDLRAGG